MNWIEKHSVNCYFCNDLVDERDCMPADPYNNNDGGDICPKCLKEKTMTTLARIGERLYSFCNEKDVTIARQIYAYFSGNQNALETEMKAKGINFIYAEQG